MPNAKYMPKVIAEGSEYTNLVDIVGEGDYGRKRVVSFRIDGSTLMVAEECDVYFVTALSIVELDLLIYALNDARARMVAAVRAENDDSPRLPTREG